jgi:hypothetical protein
VHVAAVDQYGGEVNALTIRSFNYRSDKHLTVAPQMQGVEIYVGGAFYALVDRMQCTGEHGRAYRQRKERGEGYHNPSHVVGVYQKR